MAVEAVCSRGKELSLLSEGCRVVRMPQPMLCLHKRQFYRAAIPDLLGVYRPNCHQGCVWNEYISIHNRVCGLVPVPTSHGLTDLARVAGRIAKRLGVVPSQDINLLPMHYSGAKRTRYLQAVEDLRMYPITPRDAAIKAFVKAEKTDFSSKENPDPRMIQARSMRYNCALAQYLKPVEERIYRYTRPENPDTLVFGKCLNQVERAKLLKKKMAQFKKPVVVSLDCKRFDQHVAKEQLKIEHRVYTSCNRSAEFSRLLRMQLQNKGITASGIKYVTDGKRMSGDLNTASGNCTVMFIMVEACMEKLRIFHWDCLDDGDDCLVIMESKQLNWFKRRCETIFLSYGHEIKVENVAYNIVDVEWCQSKPIEYAPGLYKFVRKPNKVLSGACTGNTHWHQGDRKSYMHTIGLCELVLNVGVPVVQEFALALIRNANTDKVLELSDNDSLMYKVRKEMRLYNMNQLVKLRAQPITLEARMSFEQAFGWPVSLQVEYEDRLRGWAFNTDAILPMGQEWTADGGWHSNMVPPYEVTLARGDGCCS